MIFPFFANPEPIYRHMAKMLCFAMYSPKYTGFEQIPEKGPAVIISNHVSYVDGLIIAAGCNRPVRFIIDAYIYNIAAVHYFMVYNRAIPIEPTRESVIKALDEVAKALEEGDLVCIFPEGQLTYTGSLGRFKTGIESIIKRNAVPVYPVALTGLWGSIFSRKNLGSIKRFIPRNFSQQVRAICGSPIPPEQVSVNYLQKAIMRLKHQALSED